MRVATRALIPVVALMACEPEAQRPEQPPARPLAVLSGYGKVTPVDEATNDASLVAFRDTLLSIAQRRDSAALSAHLAPEIKFSFGDSRGGANGFFAHWHRYQSMDRLWATLDDVLRHGGRFSAPDWFVAPWTFNALPDSLDAFEHLMVRDSNVVVFAAATSDSALGTLSFDIVRAGPYQPDAARREIRLPDGRTGYVDASRIRSPVDYRIGMRKYGQRWLIDFFVAGD